MDPILYPADFKSDTWVRLKAGIQAAIERDRTALETPSDVETTARLRGQVSAFRELLALEAAPATVTRPGAFEQKLPAGVDLTGT